MGAAIAALYTLRMWYESFFLEFIPDTSSFPIRVCSHDTHLRLHFSDLHPDRDVHGFCYATPCVISHHLIDVTARCITSFVNHYDTVPRVSVGSIQGMRSRENNFHVTAQTALLPHQRFAHWYACVQPRGGSWSLQRDCCTGMVGS